MLLFNLKNKKMKVVKKMIYVLLLGAMVQSCSSELQNKKKDNIVVIDNVKVFNEFELTKELSEKINANFAVKKQIMDSLEMQVMVLNKEIELNVKPSDELIKKFQLKREEYLYRKKQFEEEYQAMWNDYNNQIVVQMNKYLTDYGKEKGYNMILGAGGNGNVVYADTLVDVTEEVLVFLNSKYEGKLTGHAK